MTEGKNGVVTIHNTYNTTHKSTRTRVGSQIINASFMGSGAGGHGDRGSNQFLAMMDSNPYNSNDYVWRWRQYCQLYETSWEARKIIRIPVEDALRKPWTVNGLDDKALSNINNKLNQLRFTDVLKRSLMLERLLGGCLMFLGLDDDRDEPNRPYVPSKEKADLKFVNAIPLSRIARLSWCTNPLSEHYMRPEKFSINGQEIDVSRCLVWDGEPLFDPYDYALTNFRSNLGGFGPSKLAPIWDDIIKAVGSRQAAYQLIQTNNAIIMAVSQLQDLTSTNPGQEQIEELKNIANMISVYRAALIDKENVQITQSAASFGSVPELLMMFIQVLSAASDIPATRFLGQAPGGLNATGESDLENYYNVIDAYQRQRIEPQLRRIYDIIGWSMYRELWRDMRREMEFVFPPLWNMKEIEQAQLGAIRIDNALKLWQERAISDTKFLQEINAQGALSVTLDDTDIALMSDFRDQMGTGGEETPEEAEKEISSLKNTFYLQNADTLSILVRGAGYDPNLFETKEIMKGYMVEQEHADVTNGEPIEVMKIVMAHLTEMPNYYSLLEAMEGDSMGGMMENAAHPPKKRIKLHGFDINIENPVGSTRSGTDETGKDWEVVMKHAYGEIKGYRGADKDYIDVFIGPDAEKYPQAVVIDQLNAKTGDFDEHKIMLGFPTQAHALKAYLDNYDAAGMDRIGTLNPTISVKELKLWLEKEGATKEPFASCGRSY